MNTKTLAAAGFCLFLPACAICAEEAAPTPHPTALPATYEAQGAAGKAKSTVQFVTVEKDVRLEVVDWGGPGRPLILLAALGADAHIYDQFAPKLTGAYHVYGITRRGFGASSVPTSGYSADRLGDDVLAVMDFLKLNRPVLVGHSMAGEELSSVGSRHPEKVAGLIYLEAAYPYAFYDRTSGDLMIDSLELRTELEGLLPGKGRPDQKQLTRELLHSVAQVERDLKARQEELKDYTDPPRPPAGAPPPDVPIAIQGIMAGQRKYTDIRVPVLAVYAFPHDFGDAFKNDPVALAKAEAGDKAYVGPQADAFEHGVPSARVVRIAHASHVIFMSNEADVLREMNAFLGSLP
jgi:pimeloyl-ACP methyl ester carboxylesterase